VASESPWHHADNRERNTVENDGAPNYGGIASEFRLPESVPQYDYGTFAGLRTVLRVNTRPCIASTPSIRK
jgi:hypothetical protein